MNDQLEGAYDAFHQDLAQRSNSARAFDNFIGGRATPSTGDRRIEVVNPARKSAFASVPDSTDADVDAAVRAAAAQLDGAWGALPGAERGRLILRLADLVERDKELIGRMDAISIGRPVVETQILDLPNALDTMRYFAGWADKITGTAIPTGGYFGRPTHSYTRREPVGVVGAIVPWNTPFMITMWKLAPALAAGCTIVLKPAEETPLSALHLAALATEAGFPDGVINVVTGRGETAGAALVRHPLVAKITFTGGPEAGRAIGRSAADSFKRLSLELGGKSPQIVFPDADLDGAIRGLAMGIFFNQGEVCAAGSRVLVHRSIADKVAAALAGAASGVRLGDPLDPEAQMGALASRAQFDRVAGYIDIAKAEQAELLAGGTVDDSHGLFVRPTVFRGRNDMRIAQEEIFGPVVVVIPFDDEEDALRIANASSYGLAAVVWTSDVARSHRMAARLKAGSVWVNGWAAIDARLPWGGVKQSGAGRENGASALDAYTEIKTVTIVL
ncbi:aldehyde dehydrogenase family protein [Zavarzinia aquatilis]|uniref:Betaine-aldehyde dehydrogenase n=1 Tax=Zavarzinia aquatilis TaxID=2211142 RepID=A0A317DXH8_9PROT|nr:aldehyde dehydrogenase family protein [Zavarzinia aquatilis]PWR17535.1 betaine-aldehyde dehydrogenase [Zavarzinia aquatilis]